MNETTLRPVPPLTASEVALRLLNPFTGIIGLMSEAMSLSCEARSLELAAEKTQRETRVRVRGTKLAAKVAIATIRQRALQNLHRIREIQARVRSNSQHQRDLIRLINRATAKMLTARKNDDVAAIREVITSASEVLRRNSDNTASRLRRLLATSMLSSGGS